MAPERARASIDGRGGIVSGPGTCVDGALEDGGVGCESAMCRLLKQSARRSRSTFDQRARVIFTVRGDALTFTSLRSSL
jgi:hypothetical protein